MLLAVLLEAGALGPGPRLRQAAQLLQRCEALERKTATFENIVCVLNREVERVAMTAEACGRQHRLDQDRIEALSNKVRARDRVVPRLGRFQGSQGLERGVRGPRPRLRHTSAFCLRLCAEPPSEPRSPTGLAQGRGGCAGGASPSTRVLPWPGPSGWVGPRGASRPEMGLAHGASGHRADPGPRHCWRGAGPEWLGGLRPAAAGRLLTGPARPRCSSWRGASA